MTYWGNNLLFLYFRFFVFSIATLPTGSYMSQVSKQRPFLVISDYFHKISNQILIENIEMTGQKD